MFYIVRRLSTDALHSRTTEVNGFEGPFPADHSAAPVVEIKRVADFCCVKRPENGPKRSHGRDGSGIYRYSSLILKEENK